MTTTAPHPVQPINIEDEMRSSYLDYAMSVIIGRALPDARDGLKPVHRRVLYAMHELGNQYNKAYKKSARIVGDVIGKYHPHGDQAVYDALVRMAQTFSMRQPLVDGQGNFGSVDGDAPAAMRYTEVRMARIAGELLADIDKDTVDFGPNYDDSLTEPVVLPCKFPNLLVNGSAGIAVGMATNMPPHNLGEVIDATIALVRNPEVSVRELMQHVRGPDFPTAGTFYGSAALQQAYETGRGVIHLRAVAQVEEGGRGERIIISEIPYQVNKAVLVEKIADLVKTKRIEGISDLRDESSREGMRIVVELRRDANSEVVLNQLFTNTSMQTSFGLNMLAIVKGQPRVLSLKELLAVFIEHRREVVTRRCRYELFEARRRFNVVFGLLAAIDTDTIDRIIAIIRQAKDANSARQALMAEALPFSSAFRALCQEVVRFSYESAESALVSGVVKLNEEQAQAILDMRLSRLTGLEREKLADEAREQSESILRLEALLASESLLLNIIVEELTEIRQRYAEPRRTQIIHDARSLSVEDLIADEDMVVTVSHRGYLKRAAVDFYRAQNRGGRGRTAARTRDEDFVRDVFVASTHSYVLVFTDLGKVYWLKVHEIPEASPTALGKPIVNLVRLSPAGDEHVAALLPVRRFEEGRYLTFVTSRGTIKKTDLMAFANPRPSGLIALTIDPDDHLTHVELTDGKQELLIATRMGMAIRFNESEVRPMGRTARGVRAIHLKKEGDGVVGMVPLTQAAQEVLTVCTRGYGKRTLVSEYRLQGRGGSGVINCRLSERNGDVAGVVGVKPEDDVMLVTDRGMMIRLRADEISSLGRDTQGVRLQLMEDDEVVSSVALIVE